MKRLEEFLGELAKRKDASPHTLAAYAADAKAFARFRWGEAAEKAEGEAYGSFFSGHTSAAFTVAVFTGEWFSEVYPSSPYRGIVWAGSLSAAGFVGILRIAAGKHYPSDVIVGALVGTGISLSVIRLHRVKNERVSLIAGPNTLGMSVRF